MKLIELLKQQETLKALWLRRISSERGMITDVIEEEDTKKQRDLEAAVRKYNDLANEINKHLASNVVEVEGYGTLSLATANQYLATTAIPMGCFNDNPHGAEIFRITDFKGQLISEHFCSPLINGFGMSPGSYLITEEEKPYNDFMKLRTVNLRMAVMQAINEIEV